jgi:adenosylmethionine-8-amino-7-oxononanoate aminotransferase
MIELNYLVKDTHQITVARTEKYWIHTDQGSMLDLLSGNMSFIWGFDNAHILDRMYQAQRQISYLNFKSSEICADNQLLIQRLCQLSGLYAVSYSVSGTDGVECAIAMNSHYWRQVNDARKKIIGFTPGYSGASRLARSLRGQHYDPDVIVLQAPNSPEQEPAVLAAVEQRLATQSDIGAIVVESIPWADGLRPWSQTWWVQIRALCDRYSINLILDDVMGGMGKLGHEFSHSRFGITPDITVLGKALTNGFSPMSVALTTHHIAETIRSHWDYSHTWQPNMAGVAAALAVLDLFDSAHIYQVEQRLTQLAQGMEALGHSRAHVVQGLLVQLTLTRPLPKSRLLAAGLNDSPGLPEPADYKNRIMICAPALADDLYFDQLEQRLLACFDKIQ